MKFREKLSIRTVASGLEKAQILRPKVSHASLVKGSLIVIILVIAFSVRLLPIRWGYYLSEFDPHYQYRHTKYIVENGLLGDKGWVSWHDYLSWYPWGNKMSRTSYLGLPLTAAAMYLVLRALGVPIVSGPSLDPLQSDPVYVFVVLFPALMGTVTCLVMYFLGKDLAGDSAGLFAALFLALDSAYIGRTSLGFFDDETVGIFSILLYILCFLRSLDERKPLRAGLMYSVAAGLSLGYLCGSWGASRYPVVMTALFALILLASRRYSFRLLLSYGITFLLALPIAASVPYVGTGWLLEFEVLSVYGAFFLLCVSEVNHRVKTTSQKLIMLAILIGLVAGGFGFLWWRGMIRGLETKFLSVLNPFVRFEVPIVESVAEHRPSSWGTFYYNFGMGVFFVPVGLFFAAMMATNTSLFMIIYGLTSVFFASSMIRLNIIMSPVISLLWALALVRILKPFVLFLREAPQTPPRKAWQYRFVGKETSAGIVLLMFILLALTYVVGPDFIAGPQSQGPKVYTQAFSPTTVASASLSAKPSDIVRDWLDTLIWMRENLPASPERPGEPGTVVASWWDYGYWITTIANRTSLADNGTWNWTQIEQIGLMFMSNETEAVKILKRYNVTHVLVFVTFDTQGRLIMAGGDEGKWEWMAKIPGLDEKVFGNHTLGWDWVDVNRNGRGFDDYGQPEPGEISQNTRGQETVLFKLMYYGREATLQGYSNLLLEYFEEAHFSQTFGSPKPAPGTSYIPLVCVYKVNYPQE